MEHKLWYVLMGILVAYGAIEGAHATRTESGNTKVVFFDETGKKISASEADRLASQEKPVLGCEPMEKVCNEKTGKCPLRKVK